MLTTTDTGELDAAAPTGTAEETALYWAVLAQATTDDWAAKQYILEQVYDTAGDLTSDEKAFFNMDIGTSGNDSNLQAVDLFRPQIVVCGDGDDTTNVYALNHVGSIVYGGAGDDTITLGAGHNLIIGGADDDTMSAGTDSINTYVINEGDGQDTISNAVGDDTVVFTSGIGPEDLAFARSGNDLIITIGEGGGSLTVAGHFVTADYGATHAQMLERIQFTDYPEGTLTADDINALAALNTTGTSGADTIFGLNDIDDVIHGGADNDYIYGNTGSDTLYGEDGDDIIYGGLSGEYGGGGHDFLYGGEGNDELVSAPDTPTDIYGGTGDDVLAGNTGDDCFYFSDGDGNDQISYTLGGTDHIIFDESVDPETVHYTKSSINLVITYGTGEDSITVAGFFYIGYEPEFEFHDVMFSDEGLTVHSLAHIYTEALTQNGTSGADSLTAIGSSEVTYINTLNGLGGDDYLQGSSGIDILNGGTGNDYMVGYAGNDTYKFSAGDGTDTITENGGGGTDTILFDESVDPGEVTFSHNSSYNVLITYGSGDSILLYNFYYDETYRIEYVQFSDEGHTILDYDDINTLVHTINGTSSGDYLAAFDSEDTILNGFAGADYMVGGAGDDTFRGGDGADFMYGQGGADTFIFEAATAFNNVDEIYDFNTGQGDKIDISDVLDGFFNPGVDTLSDFVALANSGGNSTLSIDLDGTGSTYSMVQIAQIDGLNDLNLATLVSNGNLIVPT